MNNKNNELRFVIILTLICIIINYIILYFK